METRNTKEQMYTFATHLVMHLSYVELISLLKFTKPHYKPKLPVSGSTGSNIALTDFLHSLS